ncbi:MAG TPA: hypothetical protein VIW67_03970 [Terriglobales bacterium]|jgi:hypothetical protein
MADLSFPYKPKPWSMLFAALFFAGCFLLGWRVVTTNDKPIVLFGYTLSAEQAHVVFVGVTMASALFVLAAVPAFFVGLFSSHRLILTATQISAPKHGFSRYVTVVPLSEIKGTSLQTVRRQRFLNIHHSKGRLTIMQSFLPDANAFEQICAALSGRHS